MTHKPAIMATVALLVLPLAWATRRLCACYLDAPPRLAWFVLTVAGMGALALWAAREPFIVFTGLFLGCGLLALAVIDSAVLRLPDPITFSLAVAGLATVAISRQPLVPHLIGGLAGYGVLAGVALAFRRLRGRQGLGMGDAKLMGAAGLWLGWRFLPVVLLCACIGGLLWAAWQARRKPAFDRDTPIAFGVPLCLSIWLCWLVLTVQA